ncbi:discoidin domain-containing protein [Pseudoflavitalea sp. X16]|uniref:discoidin domain-containing protein n=1 Tax=Paraflavitalea devenefica TaxID=2716334 RepID=UPI00141ECC21|nr:discoidin domain-containing protein [Paraflavitalea devenefica]NII26574.1 discoidin domain-containing protein [Paraflavitalea devenefica]
MRYLVSFVGSLLVVLTGSGQFHVGPGESLFLQNGVTFTADSLVLIPGADITISNNTLTRSTTPIPGTTPGTNSITRVYSWTAPVTYTGEAGIFYDDAELSGNTENILQIAYRNGTAWTTTATSSINTTTNYVSYLAGSLPFNGLTATTAGVLLPITYTGFSAAVKEQYVLLNWQMGETDGLTGFDIEYSNDGRSWTTAGTIMAPGGKTDFSFRHPDMDFSTRFYRIAMLEDNGRRLYTRMITVRNNNAGSRVRMVRSGKTVILYFSGPAPAMLGVYDMEGRLLMSRNVVRQQCEITGLIPGTYVIYYVADGQKLSRKIQW